jgi:hypothetical protein
MTADTTFKQRIPPLLPGMILGDWLRVLHRNRSNVSVGFWGRIAFLTAMGVLNSVLRYYEISIFGTRIKKVQIEKPPLFIIGHWRSGTSHLLNLLSFDENLNCPNTYQTLFPHHFLCSEKGGQRIFDVIAPSKRPMDNMPFRSHLPQEDEFAIAALSTVSPYMRFLFPVTENSGYSELDSKQMTSEILDKWKASLVYFIKKLHFLNSKRLLLKSPPHLGRLGTLHELFPKAQFIHIVRHPYSVYLSTKKLWKNTIAYSFLQKIDEEFIDHLILTMYSELFSSFEHYRQRVPRDLLYELKFEDLEQEPRQTLQLMYSKMGLPGFDQFWPKAESYLESISGYRKNIYQIDEKSKLTVQRRWSGTFNRYSYPR